MELIARSGWLPYNQLHKTAPDGYNIPVIATKTGEEHWMYREVHGVTSFLESGGKILVVQRSNRVSTYPGKWAGISGSLDEGKTADEQALLEIEEETGLSGDYIRLVRKGEPLVFDDEDIQVRKVVYPYLFHVQDRDRIRLDWEHIRSEWIEPADIGSYDTMPMLKESLERVLIGEQE